MAGSAVSVPAGCHRSGAAAAGVASDQNGGRRGESKSAGIVAVAAGATRRRSEKRELSVGSSLEESDERSSPDDEVSAGREGIEEAGDAPAIAELKMLAGVAGASVRSLSRCVSAAGIGGAAVTSSGARSAGLGRGICLESSRALRGKAPGRTACRALPVFVSGVDSRSTRSCSHSRRDRDDAAGVFMGDRYCEVRDCDRLGRE